MSRQTLIEDVQASGPHNWISGRPRGWGLVCRNPSAAGNVRLLRRSQIGGKLKHVDSIHLRGCVWCLWKRPKFLHKHALHDVVDRQTARAIKLNQICLAGHSMRHRLRINRLRGTCGHWPGSAKRCAHVKTPISSHGGGLMRH